MANKRIRLLLALAAAPASVYSLDVLSLPTNSSEPAVPGSSSEISTSIISPELPPTTALPSQPATPSDDVPSPVENAASPTTELPPALATATSCISSWSSWSSAVTAYTGPFSSGTWSLVTPAVTLAGHVYYTAPAPAAYTPPPAECTFADPAICAALASGDVRIVGSAPTTVVVPATTAVFDGEVPPEVLLPSPACGVGEAACSALASAGVVDGFWDGWVVDWRDCEMEPPGIGPVALTTTDFLVAAPTEASTTTTEKTTGKMTTTGGGGRSGRSSSPRPTNTKAEATGGGLGYLVSETELLPGTATGKPEDGNGGGVAASQVVAAPDVTNGITDAAQGPRTVDLVISAPNDGAAPPSSTRLTLPPVVVVAAAAVTRTDPIPVATLAGQTIVYDPVKAPSAVYVGDFPVSEGGPAVNVGGTPVRLLPGGLLLVGSGGGKSGSPTTITLPKQPAAAATAIATDLPIATIAGMPVYADLANPGAVVVGGKSLAPGANVVLDGQTFWLGSADKATGGLQLAQAAETKGSGDGASLGSSSTLAATVTPGSTSGGATTRSSRQSGSITTASGRNETVTTSRTTTSGDGLEGYTAVPSIPSTTLDLDSSGIRVWTRKVGAVFAGFVVAGRMLV